MLLCDIVQLNLLILYKIQNYFSFKFKFKKGSDVSSSTVTSLYFVKCGMTFLL